LARREGSRAKITVFQLVSQERKLSREEKVYVSAEINMENTQLGRI